MDVAEISRHVRLLVSTLSFKADYSNFVNGTKRLLIVEGQTDKKFIESLLVDDVVCMVANQAFGANRGLGQERFNCKKAILVVVYGMSQLPITFIQVPEQLKNFKVYGIIDQDFDQESSTYTSTPRLFITDTHDLETLLLKTDSDLLYKLEDCKISEEEVKKALLLAYQIGIMRKIISEDIDEDIPLDGLSDTQEMCVDYSSFTQDYNLVVKRFVKYLNMYNGSKLSAAKEKKIIEKVLANKMLKKKVDAESKWISSVDTFDKEKVTDFWSIVNGHDILSLLRYLNVDAARKYDNKNSFSLNRDFEMDLIANYEYTSFKETKLYDSMTRENVIN